MANRQAVVKAVLRDRLLFDIARGAVSAVRTPARPPELSAPRWPQCFDGFAAGGIESVEKLSDAMFDFGVLRWIDGLHALEVRGDTASLCFGRLASQSLKCVGPRIGLSPGVRLRSFKAML